MRTFELQLKAQKRTAVNAMQQPMQQLYAGDATDGTTINA